MAEYPLNIGAVSASKECLDLDGTCLEKGDGVVERRVIGEGLSPPHWKLGLLGEGVAEVLWH